MVSNLEFYLLQRYCTKVAPLCAPGATLLQMCHRLLATLWQIFYKGCPRLLATLWQIPQRVLATFANSTYLPEGCQHPLILGQRVLIILQSNFQRVLDNLYWHLQESCPSNKQRDILYAIPLKKLKVKIKIQEATDRFKNCKNWI